MFYFENKSCQMQSMNMQNSNEKYLFVLAMIFIDNGLLRTA